MSDQPKMSDPSTPDAAPRPEPVGESDTTVEYPGLLAACRKLYDRYSMGMRLSHNRYWLVSLGAGAGEIVVYARKDFVPADLPSEVDGYPVKVRRNVGTPTLGGRR